MTPSDGSIDFAYELTPPSSPAASGKSLATLTAWSRILEQLELYDPSGGSTHLSFREFRGEAPFAITTATATGSTILRARSYNLGRGWLEVEGEAPPTADALLHATIYAADPRIEWIFQVESVAIASQPELNLPSTDSALAPRSALAQLIANHQSRPLVLKSQRSAGALFACGPTARDTGGLLVSYLAKALSHEATQGDPA